MSINFSIDPVTAHAKRVTDIVLAGTGVLLTLPLFPLIAAAIRIETRGPVFFRQMRIGKSHPDRVELFEMIKFRTMVQDAEKLSGATWATKADPRITRVGRFLRKTRLDELPQFINVIRGEMSLIGPRPERPEFVADLARDIPFYNERHRVKPGLTGWAQLCYQYGSTTDDARMNLQYDLYYVKNASLFLDLVILLETVEVVLWGKGAR